MFGINNTIDNDFEKLELTSFIPWNELKNKTVLITGATGLIGKTIVSALLHMNRKKNLNITVMALVRDEARARNRFSEELLSDFENLRFLIGTVENLPDITEDLDYIIHGASQTASGAFVHQPVETILTALQGTQNILKLALEKKVKGMIYLSSMEVYGNPKKGHKVTENDIGTMSPLNIRNSYPISKQQCESLCCAYSDEYKLPVMIARLSQTFGPDTNDNDNRIPAYFSRCVEKQEDIILKTKGETERSYIYSVDAATAILTILLNGEKGNAYNVADESTYSSIAEMAEKVAKRAGIQVRYEIENEIKNGYPAPIYMDLDTSSLKSLGWKALF